jgi:hypothetical protein
VDGVRIDLGKSIQPTGTEPDAWLNAQEKEFRILGHEEGQTARQAGTMYVRRDDQCCYCNGMYVYIFIYISLCVYACINQRLPLYDRKG